MAARALTSLTIDPVDMTDVGRREVAHRPSRPLAGNHTMVIRHPGGRAGSKHAHPAWTILVPEAEHVEWWTGQCPGLRTAGVIFPPRVAYRATSAVGHVAVFIDPWFQGLGPGRQAAVPLDPATVEHLRAVWSTVDVADLDEITIKTVTYLRRRDLLPPALPIDPRVVAALRSLPAAERIDRVAAGVGISPSRLRTLIHDLTGTSPARLRMWQRLRTAVLSLPDKPIALAAADAGFADQAHLTRTANRLLGQTPATWRAWAGVLEQYEPA
jgi:AraC-like DNA-binding protein